MFLYTYRFLYRFYGLILVSVVRVLPSSNIKHLFIIFMPSPLSLSLTCETPDCCMQKSIRYRVWNMPKFVSIILHRGGPECLNEYIWKSTHELITSKAYIHMWIRVTSTLWTMLSSEKFTQCDNLKSEQNWIFFSVFSLVAVVANCFNPKTWSYVERQRDSEIMMI